MVKYDLHISDYYYSQWFTNGKCSRSQLISAWQWPGTNNINGCTDSLANNFDALATIDDGTCQYFSGIRVHDQVDMTWYGSHKKMKLFFQTEAKTTEKLCYTTLWVVHPVDVAVEII